VGCVATLSPAGGSRGRVLHQLHDWGHLSPVVAVEFLLGVSGTGNWPDSGVTFSAAEPDA